MKTPNCFWILLIFLTVSHLFLSKNCHADNPKSPPLPVVTCFVSSPFPWSFGGRDSWNFKPISSDDPNKPIVEDEISSLVSRYQKGGLATANVADPAELKTGALTHLFPKYKFYMIGWSEEPVPGKPMVNLGLGIFYCLAVSAEGKTRKLWGTNDISGYGQFLFDNGITIKSIDDARQVWLAFCDIAQKPLHSQDLMQVSPSEWHLGIDTDHGRSAYYKFVLNTSKKVISAE